MADRFEHPNQMIRPHGKHDRKVKLQDPHPVYQKLLPQDYHLRKTKLFIRYSVVSADPAGGPSFEGFAFYLRVAARLVDFPMENSTAQPALGHIQVKARH